MSTLTKIDTSTLRDFSIAPPVEVNTIETDPLQLAISQQQSQAELDLAYNRGFTEGQAKVENDAKLELQETQNILLEKVCTALDAAYRPILVENQRSKQLFMENTLDVVCEFISQLHNTALPEIIDNLLAPILDTITEKDSDTETLHICLNPKDADIFQDILHEKIQARLPNMRLSIQSTKSVATGDCFIEWRDNAIKLDKQRTQKHVRQLIEKTFANNDTQETK